MHTSQEYDTLQKDIEATEQEISSLQITLKQARSRLRALFKQKLTMERNTIGELSHQQLAQKSKEIDEDYLERMKQWKKELQDNETELLDNITPYYLVVMEHLSEKQLDLLIVLLDVDRPLSFDEVLENKRFKGKTKKYIHDILYGDGKYYRSPNGVLDLKIFDRTSDAKVRISVEDPYFKKWLQMREILKK